MLFILDILKKELKIFDTSNLKLISKYETIGTSPYKFCIGEEGKYIYVANKGAGSQRYKSSIFILDIINGKNSIIDFEKGTILTSMELCDKFIYLINEGLQKLQIIDISKGKNIDILKTSLKKPEMFNYLQIKR